MLTGSILGWLAGASIAGIVAPFSPMFQPLQLLASFGLGPFNVPADIIAVIGGVTGLGIVESVWASSLLFAGAVISIPIAVPALCIAATISCVGVASGVVIGSGVACGGCAIGVMPVLADLVPNLTNLT